MKLKDIEVSPNRNLYLLTLSAIVGIFAGLVTSLYRFVLQEAEEAGLFIYSQISKNLFLLILFIPLIFLFAYIVTNVIVKNPLAKGSGIPQVKGQLQGYFRPSWSKIAFSKFVAGTLAMLSGLSLGREGPSIQIGASMGQAIGEKLAQTERHRRLLIASGASAGLATAFNAPLSGVMFTLEEVFKYFSPLILLTCMTSAVVADSISRAILGSSSVFHFSVTGSISLSNYWLLIILGIILGIFGAIYNWTLLLGQKLMKKIEFPFIRVLISFLTTGLMGLFFPIVLGSGHKLIGQLTFGWSIGFLSLIFILKFFISIISYVSDIPGGIFFPLLVLGASIGAIFATFVITFFHLPTSLFPNFVILSMAGAFTAIVRAPMTGIVLLVEMTGSFSHLLPLALVSLIAYVIADLFKSEPIYDSLLKNLLISSEPDVVNSNDKMTIEVMIEYESDADHNTLAQLKIPKNCLIVGLHRNGEDIIPKGDTELLAGDYLTCIISQTDEFMARETIKNLVTEKFDSRG